LETLLPANLLDNTEKIKSKPEETSTTYYKPSITYITKLTAPQITINHASGTQNKHTELKTRFSCLLQPSASKWSGFILKEEDE